MYWIKSYIHKNKAALVVKRELSKWSFLYFNFTNEGEALGDAFLTNKVPVGLVLDYLEENIETLQTHSLYDNLTPKEIIEVARAYYKNQLWKTFNQLDTENDN